MWSSSIHTRSEKIPDITGPTNSISFLKASHKDLRICCCFEYESSYAKPQGIERIKEAHYQNQSNKNRPPITELKGTELCDLTDKEFRIAVLRKLQ